MPNCLPSKHKFIFACCNQKKWLFTCMPIIIDFQVIRNYEAQAKRNAVMHLQLPLSKRGFIASDSSLQLTARAIDEEKNTIWKAEDGGDLSTEVLFYQFLILSGPLCLCCFLPSPFFCYFLSLWYQHEDVKDLLANCFFGVILNIPNFEMHLCTGHVVFFNRWGSWRNCWISAVDTCAKPAPLFP